MKWSGREGEGKGGVLVLVGAARGWCCDDCGMFGWVDVELGVDVVPHGFEVVPVCDMGSGDGRVNLEGLFGVVDFGAEVGVFEVGAE